MKDGTYNAIIRSTSLSTADHNKLIFWLHTDHECGSQGFGGFGEQHTARIIRVALEAAGVHEFSKLPGRAIRLKIEDGIIVGIGHIVENRWFTRDQL